MGLFTKYKHIESQVTAVQMSDANLKTVLDRFKPEIARCAIAEFTIGKDADQNYQIVFRYNSSTQPSVLSNTDYLIRLNNGDMVVVSEKDFSDRYINSTVDKPVRPTTPKTLLGAMLTLVNKYFPDIEVNDVDGLTPEVLARVGEGLRDWYDESEDLYTFKFSDAGITDPLGLGKVIEAFAAASYIKESTRFILDFTNGATEDDDPTTLEYNQFNNIGLTSMLGELRTVSGVHLARIARAYFFGRKAEVPSAVAPSVSEEQVTSFANKMCNMTGILHPTDIKV